MSSGGDSRSVKSPERGGKVRSVQAGGWGEAAQVVDGVNGWGLEGHPDGEGVLVSEADGVFFVRQRGGTGFGGILVLTFAVMVMVVVCGLWFMIVVSSNWILLRGCSSIIKLRLLTVAKLGV